jgi:hypothetical protein
MIRPILAAPAGLLALLLAACGGDGGGGGGVVSTPPPVPGTYVRMVDAVGNGTASYSFQATGVAYTGSPAGFSGASSYALGGGATIAYNASSDTFTVTAPGGSASFTGAHLVPSAPGTVKLVKSSGSSADELTLTVPLTYGMVTVWNHQDLGSPITGRLAIGGSQTQASDVPKTGSASYSVSVAGAAQSAGTTYNLTSSTGTFTANFGGGTVQTSVTLAGPPANGGAVSNFGTFSGSGNLSSGGPGFAGTLSGGSGSGIFQGAFFGPQAAEVGYGYVIPGTSFSSAGVVIGTKN